MLCKRNEEDKGREGDEEREREKERAEGNHAGRMTRLLRRGEESGGYDRRRVQIITIIIFPGNMAAERGWPPGWCTRRREPSASERKRVKQRARMKEGGRAGAGREGYHNITNHRRRDVSIQPLTLAHVRAFLALVSTTPILVPPSLALVYIPSSTTRSRRFAYTLPKFPARNSHERSHPAIVALYTSTPHPDFSLSLSHARFPRPSPHLLPPCPPFAILPPVALPRPSPSRSISVSAVRRVYTIP